MSKARQQLVPQAYHSILTSSLEHRNGSTNTLEVDTITILFPTGPFSSETGTHLLEVTQHR